MANALLATTEMVRWYDNDLDDFQRGLANYVIELLRANPTNLGHPYSSQVDGRIRELRVQNVRNPLRIFYAMDRQRDVVLLVGGNKRGLDGVPARKWATEHAQRAEQFMRLHDTAPNRSLPFRIVGKPVTPVEEQAQERTRTKGTKYGQGFDMEVARRERREADAASLPVPPVQFRKLRAAGFAVHQILFLTQPGAHLDPKNPDFADRVEKLVKQFGG